MLVNFTKMHGLGNDFMVLDRVRQDLTLTADRIRALADRRTGIGFDQLLLVEPPTDPACDFLYRIYNADGGEVEHCGNGARCLARFIMDQGLGLRPRLVLQLASGGRAEARVHKDGQVTVDMGAPVLEPAAIPFEPPGEARPDRTWTLPVQDGEVAVCAVSMGNPHAVLEVGSVDSAPVAELGPLIESHAAFPRRVNAGFMEIVNRRHIRLRVYERGAGETQACGTGACAAVVAGRLRGYLEDPVTVELLGGKLSIHWKGEGEPVLMTGPAVKVFDGRIEL